MKRFQKSVHGFYFRGPNEIVNGRFEDYLCEFVARNQTGFSSLVNVGANVGIYPCIALQNNYETIVAMEPDMVNFKNLKANIERNGWADKASVLNITCAAEPGTGLLFGRNTGATLIPFWEGNTASKGVKIETVRLDSLLLQMDLTKKVLVVIDVESFEFDVIRGSSLALQLLDTFTWLIEVSFHRSIDGRRLLTPELGSIFSKFLNIGYQVIVFDSI